MVDNIYSDHSRFKKIIKNKIKANLKKFIVDDSIIGKEGDKFVKIPVPKIHLPKFIHDPKNGGGISQGDGDVGDIIGKGKQKNNNGDSEAGNQESDHTYDVEMSIDELGKILGEELQLHDLKLKQKQANIIVKSKKYLSTNKTGPSGLIIYKRSYRQALARSLAEGEYNYNKPVVIPRREDLIYKYPKTIEKPDIKVVIFYLMDVSGSISDEIRDIVRTTCYWIDIWLQHNYKKLEMRYIVHDVKATEVEKEFFYKINTSGGTQLSSAIKLCNKIIDEEYDQDMWNIYVFQFTDGDTWGEEDEKRCVTEILDLQPKVNLYSYCEINTRRARDTFLGTLQAAQRFSNIRSIKIAKREQIVDVIKKFFRD